MEKKMEATIFDFAVPTVCTLLSAMPRPPPAQQTRWEPDAAGCQHSGILTMITATITAVTIVATVTTFTILTSITTVTTFDY